MVTMYVIIVLSLVVCVLPFEIHTFANYFYRTWCPPFWYGQQLVYNRDQFYLWHSRLCLHLLASLAPTTIYIGWLLLLYYVVLAISQSAIYDAVVYHVLCPCSAHICSAN